MRRRETDPLSIAALNALRFVGGIAARDANTRKVINGIYVLD